MDGSLNGGSNANVGGGGTYRSIGHGGGGVGQRW